MNRYINNLESLIKLAKNEHEYSHILLQYEISKWAYDLKPNEMIKLAELLLSIRIEEENDKKKRLGVK